MTGMGGTDGLRRGGLPLVGSFSLAELRVLTDSSSPLICFFMRSSDMAREFLRLLTLSRLTRVDDRLCLGREILSRRSFSAFSAWTTAALFSEAVRLLARGILCWFWRAIRFSIVGCYRLWAKRCFFQFSSKLESKRICLFVCLCAFLLLFYFLFFLCYRCNCVTSELGLRCNEYKK